MVHSFLMLFGSCHILMVLCPVRNALGLVQVGQQHRGDWEKVRSPGGGYAVWCGTRQGQCLGAVEPGQQLAGC